jgi:choline dehydrogenase-like flavoprotein
MDQKYEFIIVGSGAGGATLAHELSKRGKRVLVLERGQRETQLGTFQDSLRYFDGNKLTKIPLKSREGVILWRTFQSGGSTVVSCGNGVRSLEKELDDLGINISAELDEAESETGTAPISEKLLSEGSQAIRQAANDLGYTMDLMPKFINSDKCMRCSHCAMGCAHGAKWTAEEYLNRAVLNKAEIWYGSQVEKVLISNGKASGVIVSGLRGNREIAGEKIIVSAGGLGTPVILQRSGILEAGTGLFTDLFVNVFGNTSGISNMHEPTMALVDMEFHQSQGFLLSPFYESSKMVRFIELGPRGLTMSTKGLLGIMVKITDDASGSVYPDGSISKTVTVRDQTRLNNGVSKAREILIKAGAEPKSIVVSKVQGAHPGGTAAIGKVVDQRLQTRVDGLFVCDVSVFPYVPGLPPILTLIALAKRLAGTLAV